MNVPLSFETLAGLTPDERTMILFEAAASGDTALLHSVLAFPDVDPNAVDPGNRYGRGTRPLHLASGKTGLARPAAVALLLAHGASPSQSDATNTWPLHLAAYAVRADDAAGESVTHLLAAHRSRGEVERALREETTLRGFGTPLQHAVRAGYVPAVHQLLAAGAPADESGEPPLLHLAVMNRAEDAEEAALGVLAALLAAGASPSRTNARGQTAWELAARPRFRAALEKAALERSLPIAKSEGLTETRAPRI